MKTIHPNNPRLQQRFAAEVILPNRPACLPAPGEISIELATHDFLVLTARPDLMPENRNTDKPITTRHAFSA